MQPQCVSPVFAVSDFEASLRYYIDVLGFQESFRYGQYAGVMYGDVEFHLALASNPNMKPAGSGTAYVICDEVDTFYEDISARGAKIQREPETAPYGMRDFNVFDLDENMICFGTKIESS